MKYAILVFILSLSSCYVYRPYEPSNEDEFLTFREQIEPEKEYKIAIEGQNLKIIADNWEGDSLIAYTNKRKNDTLKIAENQIQKVEHRVFSRGRSDALTFGVYGALGVLIYFLLN